MANTFGGGSSVGARPASRVGAALTLALALIFASAQQAGAAPVVTAAGTVPAAASVPLMPLTATALRSFDTQMIDLVNQARVAAGVPRVAEATGLTQLSVWWSAQMDSGATGYQLQHNPNAWTMVLTYGAANRTAWGENVASSSSTGSSAQDIFSAYMNSPGHRANILSTKYRYIGMGTVGGAHGLYNTTEFTDAVQPGQAVSTAVPVPVPTPTPAPATISNGDFITDTTTHAVYRVAGGAPVYISSWTPFGGARTTKAISHDRVVAMPRYPAAGTFLRAAGGTGAVYRVAGGAPVYVSSWAPFGGAKAVVDIDPAAVSNGGGTGYWIHLRAQPADGTLVRTPGSGAIYRMAGGAPLYVATWAGIGGAQPTVDLDPAAVAHGGQSGYWSHLRWYPSTTTYVMPYGSPAVYQVVDGVATHLTSWSLVGGVKPTTVIHPLALSSAGGSGYYSHLKN